MRHTLTITLALVSILLVALSPAGAQEACPETDAVVVETIVDGLETLETTPGVFVLRLGSVEREQIERCMKLEIGDQLESPRGRVIVELRCPAGSSLTLSETFRAVVAPPIEKQDCNVDLAIGVLASNSTSPTGVGAGPVGAGADETQYEVRVGREDGKATQSVRVYEGRVRVTSVDETETTTRVLEPGKKVLHQRGEWNFTDIDASDVARTSRVWARLSTSRADVPADQQGTVFRQFSELYARALFRPEDAYSQLELAETQLRYRMPEAALRQLSRARQAPAADPEILRRMDALETTVREIELRDRYEIKNEHLERQIEQLEQKQILENDREQW